MSIKEILETFKEREEWVVKGSKMYDAIESAAGILEMLEETPYYRYDPENHKLESVCGNEKTTTEIQNFIENELGIRTYKG